METVNKVFHTKQEFDKWDAENNPPRHYDFYNEPGENDFPYFLHGTVEIDNPRRGWHLVYIGFPIRLLGEYLGE